MSSNARSLGPGGSLILGTVTGTGQLGGYIDFSGLPTPPTNYTLEWHFTGTAPAAGTFQAEGSLDAVNWYGLTDPTSCTGPYMLHISPKPVVFFRVNILTYTPGDGTTALTFTYTRGA